MRRLKCVTHVGVNDGKDATTNFMRNERNESVAVICIFDHSHTVEQIYALIVHEAVHVWQEIKRVLGEKDAGNEIEAYSIQALCEELFIEYKRQKPKKKNEPRS